MEEKDKPKSKVPRIFGLIFVLFVLMYLAIAIPSWPTYRPKHFCHRAEADAYNIAAAISDYFAVPEHTEIKPGDLYGGYTTENPWTLIQCGNTIYIYVYDLKEDCSVDYQNFCPEWDSHIYTKIMEW